LVSVLVTSQKYSSIATAVRENLSGCMIASSTAKQVELIAGDWNYLKDKNTFRQLFQRQTRDEHAYFIANLEDPAVYLDHAFLPLPHLGDD
jgi:hypothetical protein